MRVKPPAFRANCQTCAPARGKRGNVFFGRVDPGWRSCLRSKLRRGRRASLTLGYYLVIPAGFQFGSPRSSGEARARCQMSSLPLRGADWVLGIGGLVDGWIGGRDEMESARKRTALRASGPVARWKGSSERQFPLPLPSPQGEGAEKRRWRVGHDGRVRRRRGIARRTGRGR